MFVIRSFRLAVSWSAWAWVSVPAVTAASRSDFRAATSAAIRPDDDLPLVALATWASVLPDWRSVCRSLWLRPR